MRVKWAAEICSGFDAGSYLRLINFVYHLSLGLRVIKKKKGRLIVDGLWLVVEF